MQNSDFDGSGKKKKKKKEKKHKKDKKHKKHKKHKKEKTGVTGTGDAQENPAVEEDGDSRKVNCMYVILATKTFNFCFKKLLIVSRWLC